MENIVKAVKIANNFIFAAVEAYLGLDNNDMVSADAIEYIKPEPKDEVNNNHASADDFSSNLGKHLILLHFRIK